MPSQRAHVQVTDHHCSWTRFRVPSAQYCQLPLVFGEVVQEVTVPSPLGHRAEALRPPSRLQQPSSVLTGSCLPLPPCLPCLPCPLTFRTSLRRPLSTASWLGCRNAHRHLWSFLEFSHRRRRIQLRLGTRLQIVHPAVHPLFLKKGKSGRQTCRGGRCRSRQTYLYGTFPVCPVQTIIG